MRRDTLDALDDCDGDCGSCDDDLAEHLDAPVLAEVPFSTDLQETPGDWVLTATHP